MFLLCVSCNAIFDSFAMTGIGRHEWRVKIRLPVRRTHSYKKNAQKTPQREGRTEGMDGRGWVGEDRERQTGEPSSK